MQEVFAQNVSTVLKCFYYKAVPLTMEFVSACARMCPERN